MKNFQEKEIKDLAVVTGGRDGTITIGFTVDNVHGWFNGIKGDESIEFDHVSVSSK